ncbi:hypothetical protein H2200_010201 [Cladophialophora chaetospira]|uniref:Uncharacterized protein n=1 Tax=Cladophialophora chaetospira TaxID=386627 RepID=A0AA38X2F7_9EURO|nr:hypothetical protein H2200_010201 [Cladophialophora chaetospira]
MNPAWTGKKRSYVDLTDDLSDKEIDPRTVLRPRRKAPNTMRNQCNPQQTRRLPPDMDSRIVQQSRLLGPNTMRSQTYPQQTPPTPIRPNVTASVLGIPASLRMSNGFDAAGAFQPYQQPQPYLQPQQLRQPARPARPVLPGSFPAQRVPQLPRAPARPALPVKVAGHNYHYSPILAQANALGARTVQPVPSSLNATPRGIATPRASTSAAPPSRSGRPVNYPPNLPHEAQAVGVPRQVQEKIATSNTSQISGTGVTRGQKVTNNGAQQPRRTLLDPVSRKVVTPLSRSADNTPANTNDFAISTASNPANSVVGVQEGTSSSVPSKVPLNACQSAKPQETYKGIYDDTWRVLGFDEEFIAANNKAWDEQFARIDNPLDGDVFKASGAGVPVQHHSNPDATVIEGGTQEFVGIRATGFDWAALQDDFNPSEVSFGAQGIWGLSEQEKEHIDGVIDNFLKTPSSSSGTLSISARESSTLSSKTQTPDTVAIVEVRNAIPSLSARSLRPSDNEQPSATSSTVPIAAAQPPPARKVKHYRTSEHAKEEARRQCGMVKGEEQKSTGSRTLELYIPVELGGDDPDSPLPPGTSLEDICQRFPNHMVGAGLDAFLQWRWSYINIWNAVPEATKRLWYKCGVIGKNLDDPRFFLCNRLRDRRDELLDSKQQAFARLMLGGKLHPSGMGYGRGIPRLDKHMQDEGCTKTKDGWVLGETGLAAQVNPNKRGSDEIDQDVPAEPQPRRKKAKARVNSTTALATLASPQPLQEAAAIQGLSFDEATTGSSPPAETDLQAAIPTHDNTLAGNASHGTKRAREDDESIPGKRARLDGMPAMQGQVHEPLLAPLSDGPQFGNSLDLGTAPTGSVNGGDDIFSHLDDTGATSGDLGLFSAGGDFHGAGLNFDKLLNADDTDLLEWYDPMMPKT